MKSLLDLDALTFYDLYNFGPQAALCRLLVERERQERVPPIKDPEAGKEELGC